MIIHQDEENLSGSIINVISKGEHSLSIDASQTKIDEKLINIAPDVMKRDQDQVEVFPLITESSQNEPRQTLSSARTVRAN